MKGGGYGQSERQSRDALGDASDGRPFTRASIGCAAKPFIIPRRAALSPPFRQPTPPGQQHSCLSPYHCPVDLCLSSCLFLVFFPGSRTVPLEFGFPLY